MRSGKLFRPPLAVTPTSKRPRVSVRRWAFWNESGACLRDVQDLSDGLNVVWAADTAATSKTAASAGHGAGKTTFCRLLRYGLGDALADDLRDRLVRKFGVARIGLVVDVDGEQLVVARSIQPEPLSIVLDGSRFDDVPKIELRSKGGLNPLRDSLVACFNGSATSSWGGLLPIMTRDQDARREVAAWRDPPKGTREARGGELLKMLDIFSKAVGEADDAALARKKEEDSAERAAAEEAAQVRFRAIGIAARLRKQLGLSKRAEDDDAVAGAERVVQEAAAAVERQTKPSEELLRLRNERSDLDARARKLDQAVAQATGHIEGLDEQLKLFEQQQRDAEGREAEAARASGPSPTTCPRCGQALTTDAAREHMRSEGKKELAATRANLTDIATQKTAAASSRKRWEAARASSRGELAELERARQALIGKLDTLEGAHQRELGIAQHVEREARDLAATVKRPPRAPQKKTRRSRKAAQPELDVLGRRNLLQEKHDAIIREVLGDEAHAELSFAGNVVDSSVDLDGPTGGTALRVVSVLAFDVAAMILRAEGHLPGPAFLVHDSPREGDMSPLYYEKYFRLFLKLEELGGACFQSFVTTTTPVPKAPPELRKRVRATLRGAAKERLLKCAF